MSKVLESLVARGRRVRNFREQREITFGLADLSTHPDIHERLVKKGGVDTLSNLLTTAQDAEAQQFAALAIANTSSTASLCNDIVKLEGVVTGLIQYVENEHCDSIGRQYCSMALGNLLSEPSTHEEIVHLGCIDALITMLKHCTVGRELESGKNAAFAISNLASNRLYHDQIVEKGAIELLVVLACCEDTDTQRQSLSALRGLCVTVDNRLKVIQKGFLDPLILMSRSKDIDIVREVSSAFNCLSSEADNKEEISYRSISTLIYFLMSGDSEIERNACCAIANLMEVNDIHPRFLEERGIPPLVALCSSPDEVCRIEASRAISNLSSNSDLIDVLIKEQSLGPLVKSLEEDKDKCRFSALAIANFATHAPSLFKIVNAGAIPHLVSLVSSTETNLEGRRYGALALANMTACEAFHPAILEAGGPEALFALSNSCDTVSQHYVGCALANLSSNIANHEPIVEMGALQPIIALAYDPDQNVHQHAAAALRGFSATGSIKMKIVQEGGLEPLCRLLLSEDHEVLRETTACLCNLSLGDENKFEITKCGAVVPLISHIESEDFLVACHACECLANLAEMPDNQDFIAREGAIIPCIAAMRSRHIEVQRESGRLLANLSASSNKFAADTIIDVDGHHLLMSFLLSQDTGCQRVGSYGIGNLCTNDHHRVTLMKAGVLEPLTSLTRSGKIELEIRRFSMLAIANLAACFDNHDGFVEQGTIPMLISFSNSDDPEIRNYAAYTVAELSKNSDMMEIITEEGGLEPVLYLARSDDKQVQRNILPALTTLSFLDRNKSPICINGALCPIIDCINESKNSTKESQLACCAIANLAEAADNLQSVVNHGGIPLLIDALESDSDSVQRESARAIGNLAVNIDYCDSILKHGATERLIACFQSRICECQRMAAMALSNLSSNLKSHPKLLESNILTLVKAECHASLDPKRFSDHETARFCILIISNMTGGKQNHPYMADFFDILMDFTRHRDVKCRQHAVLALGNLCTNPLHVKRLIDMKCMDALVSFSFPPTTEDSVNAQFQAIAGLHGLSKQVELRVPLLREGGLEPLILGVRGNNRFADKEIKREAAAALSNLALAKPNRILISKSGALPALVTIVKEGDSICQVHAVTALANLAETSEEIHNLLINEHCIQPLCQLIQEKSVHNDIKRAASRCFALFASNAETHPHLLLATVIESIRMLITSTKDVICERYGILTVANLALQESNHFVLLESKLVESFPLSNQSTEIESLRGIAFALHSFSTKEENHYALEHAEVVKFLPNLLRCGDHEAALQACLTVKYLCQCERCRNIFVESSGLEPLLNLSSSDDLELKRELSAALRNISLSDENKKAIMVEGGMDIVATLCRNTDNEISHQACGVIANLAEDQENKVAMVKGGIIHHLQFAMLSKSTVVTRESIRAFANLSAAEENTPAIVSSGTLTHLIEALHSTDVICRRFSAMAMSNLATNEENQVRIVHEQGVLPLISIVRQVDRNCVDTLTQQHAMASLANLAGCHGTHKDLIVHGCAELSMDCIKSSDLDLRTHALLCFSNFASNRENHSVLKKCCSIQEVITNLDCHNRLVRLRAVTSLRGLSTDSSFRKEIISNGGAEALLSFVHSDDTEIKIEVLSTLCNLSLGGCMGDRANSVLRKVDMHSLIAFLCNTDSTHRLFGAVAIGNIASHLNLQAPIFDSGALQPLIGTYDNSTSDMESQRCIAYAMCNLASDVSNRMSIVNTGGLPSIMYLCQTGDTADMLAALSTLRGLAASDGARRTIFEEGVLFVLSLAMKSGCLQCKREVASILVLLSLNEENKFDLARSDEMKDFILLTEESDVHCVSQMCRSVGNICEVMDLHSDVLNVFTVARLIHLNSHPDQAVILEVARCFANLSCNFKTQSAVATPQMIATMGVQCSNSDADTRRYSSLALANLCVNVNMLPLLKEEDLIYAIYDTINCDLPHSVGKIIDEETLPKMIESKCFACMAVSALCADASIAQQFMKIGLVHALVKMLHLGSRELELYIAFVFNKLSMVNSIHDELSQHQTTSMLVKHIQKSNSQAHTYSIAALRRLCDGNNTRKEMLANETISFLVDFCDLENAERCREIASCICHFALWVNAKSHILNNQNMFNHILNMGKSDDEETSRFALGALANIAEDIHLHDVIMEKGDIVQSLLRLTQDDNVSIVRESSRALSNLLSSKGAQQVFLGEHGISSLLQICEVEDQECVYNAAVAFRKLAANTFAHEFFFAQDGIATVRNLTSYSERNVRIQSASALRDISSNADFKLSFAESGGIRTAIELSSASDVELKIIAIGIVRHLSMSMPLKVTLLDSGIVTIIADCIAHMDDEDLLCQCASSIANMAEHGQNKVALVQMGTLHCLVSLCKCEHENVKKETARAFSLLSSAPENTIGAFDRKVIPAVLELLQCQDEATCRDSAAAISNIASNHDNKVLIGSLEGIRPLILLLESPYDSCQRNSCRALSRLTVLEENKISTFNHGGLETLIRLCDSSNEDVLLLSIMVLCNLSTCAGFQIKFVEQNALPTLKRISSSDHPLPRQYATMVLCNLTSHNDTQDHVARQLDFIPLIELMNDVSLECRVYATMTLCNLASKQVHGSAILTSGGLPPLANMLSSADTLSPRRAALLALFNLSTCEKSHNFFASNNVVQSIVLSCRNSDTLCRRFALMILSNIACNEKTRFDATKGGGLQSAVLSLKDDDATCRKFACICLANMGNDSATQSQIVVHGGLPSLVSLCCVKYDVQMQDCAFMCLSNLAANSSNHSPLMKQGAFKAFVDTSSASKNDSRIYHIFGIANLTSNSEILSQIGKGGGLRPLIALSKMKSLHVQCLALSSLRRLALIRDNRDKLIMEGILQTLTHACKTGEPEISREIASCFCNLTLSSNHRIDIVEMAISELAHLTKKNDFDTVRLSLGAIGNLAEDINTHQFMRGASTPENIIACLSHPEIAIKREAARAIANLLSSKEMHSSIINRGLDDLILISTNACEECRYLTALCFRKLSPTASSHHTLINSGLKTILSLVKVQDKKTRKHALTTLRDLSASGNDKNNFFQLGAIGSMVELLKGNDKDLQIIAIATLRHLSTSECIKEDFAGTGVAKSVIRCISWANEDMMCQIAGLFANLSEHRECHTAMISNGVIQSVATLSSTEHDEIWQDIARALANLCANEEKQAVIYRQGGLKTLVKLSKSKCEVCQRYVAISMRFIVSSVEVQKMLAKENGFSPFLDFSGSSLLDFQRSAAAAMAAMSLNQTGKSMVLKKGGVKSILRLCIHLDAVVQRDAIFCVANFAASPDFRLYVVKEGGIETVKAVATTNHDMGILRDASRALSSFSIDSATKAIMISQEIPKVLSKLAKSPDHSTQRFASLALCNLCLGTLEQREDVVKQGVLRVLLFLLRFPDLEVERCASLAIAALSLGSTKNKMKIIEHGFIRPLIDTVTYPDVNMQQCALLALNGVALGELPETKTCVFQENGLSPLIALVRSEDDECIHAGIYMLGSLSEDMSIRDALIAMNAVQYIIEKSTAGSIEIKRAAAYLFSRLSECPEYHEHLKNVGGLESVVALASLVDEECQDYGAFSLACLANNKSFQVPLVQIGGVRPCVSMMATNSESKHYAALALLKLADNFANHITIAEEGGIQALLKLGRGKCDDNIQYKAALSVAHMAKNAAND